MFNGINSHELIQATVTSLGFGITTALISGVVGMIMAWLVSRTEFPGRRSLAGLLSVPYAIPAYLLGMAWVVLGNPTVGLLRGILPGSGSYGFWGFTLVEASVAFSYPYLELCAGFERLDPALEEAARISGASPWRVFRDISYPLLWPSMVNGMCLAFLYALSAFGVPALLGLPVRQFVLTTLIYSQLKAGGMGGIYSGLKLSLLLLFLAVIVLFISNRLVAYQRRRSSALSGAKSSRPSLIRLGGWTVPVTFGAWSLFFVTVVLPWFALGLSALAPVAGNYSPSRWTLAHIQEILALSDFQDALMHSLLLTVTVASVVVGGGFLLAFLSIRRGKNWATALIEFSGVPFATPGTVLAIAIIFVVASFNAKFSRQGVSIDFPLILMAVAYGLKYAAVGARSTAAAFTQVHPALEEAARVSGATTGELLRTIWFPLLKKSLLAAWLLAALPMLTELTMSVLLTGPGAQTLGTVLFELQEYRDQPSAAALAWMLLTLAILVGFTTRKKAEIAS